VSSSNSQIPSRELGARRVTESPPVDFASVEYIVSNTSITKAKQVNAFVVSTDAMATVGWFFIVTLASAVADQGDTEARPY
jgi:hypothetical protein